MPSFVRPSQLSGVPIGANISTSLLQSNTEVALNNTAVETSLFSFTLIGGTMGASDILFIELCGLYNCSTASSDNLTLRVKLGGTAILATVLLLNGIITNEPTFSRCWLKNNASVSSQKAVMRADESFGYNAPYGTAAINTAVNQTLQVTAQFASALSTMTWTLIKSSVVLLRST